MITIYTFFHIANFQRSAAHRTRGRPLFYIWHFAFNIKNGSLDRKLLPYLNLQIDGVWCTVFGVRYSFEAFNEKWYLNEMTHRTFLYFVRLYLVVSVVFIKSYFDTLKPKGAFASSFQKRTDCTDKWMRIKKV